MLRLNLKPQQNDDVPRYMFSHVIAYSVVVCEIKSLINEHEFIT